LNEVKLPRLGVTMKNGTVINWLVEEGEFVEKGDYLFELETEKSTIEIEALSSGVLKKIIIPEGKEVPVNTVIAIITEENEEVDLSKYLEPTNSQPEIQNNRKTIEPKANNTRESNNTGQAGILPKARKLAKELNISIESLVGTGKNGIITERDVLAAANENIGISVSKKIPLNNVKRAMAENMLNSWRTIPQFTQMVSVNMENALQVKKEIKDVTLNDIIIKAVGNAVKSQSIVNSKLEDNQIIVFDDINVSVAVNSKHGLVVPVIKNVEKKSVAEISNEVRSLADKANNNQLTLDDYANGTITVSNLGSMGIEAGTPIINSPQSTIVFVGAIQKMPIVNNDGEIVVAPIMTISICYDHRFIDGVTGAQFTNEVKQTFENLTVEDLI
jgi:pyruvate dehydrogenase E2 component (dihydrolipoamide acetyltransferase)